ncbi:hypothetical protein [Limosilactobacillus ingluviei]|uniref:hypothetical protein n=1 Tax=Limosilactobacillus ingluviei TaxID=148604 RepID=UPI0002FDFF5C|nr:hypothetical protein [Limosilactobacillus ingluviei]
MISPTLQRWLTHWGLAGAALLTMVSLLVVNQSGPIIPISLLAVINGAFWLGALHRFKLYQHWLWYRADKRLLVASMTGVRWLIVIGALGWLLKMQNDLVGILVLLIVAGYAAVPDRHLVGTVMTLAQRWGWRPDSPNAPVTFTVANLDLSAIQAALKAAHQARPLPYDFATLSPTDLQQAQATAEKPLAALPFSPRLKTGFIFDAQQIKVTWTLGDVTWTIGEVPRALTAQVVDLIYQQMGQSHPPVSCTLSGGAVKWLADDQTVHQATQPWTVQLTITPAAKD